LPALEAAHERGVDPKWATLATFLAFLSAFPDSHIARKLRAEAAHAVQSEAAEFRRMLEAAERPDQLLPAFLAWDSALKAKGINPGTSADLTVATLFAYRLRTILPSARNSG
jgi:triphosphoribosyl-dephospho-CoA synthase